jgi:hypothetical protein
MTVCSVARHAGLTVHSSAEASSPVAQGLVCWQSSELQTHCTFAPTQEPTLVSALVGQGVDCVHAPSSHWHPVAPPSGSKNNPERQYFSDCCALRESHQPVEVQPLPEAVQVHPAAPVQADSDHASGAQTPVDAQV